MTPRFLPLVLASVVAVSACGPRPPAKETQARRSGSTPQAVTAALDVALANGVRLDFRVTNGTSRSVELNFPSGHTHDFVVMDTTGREIWKWSDGRLFTQAMQNRVLEREESVSYRAAWDPGSMHGTFLAVVSLRSDNHPMEQRVRFQVP